MLLSLFTAAMYYLASSRRGSAVPLRLLLPFHALPALGSLLWLRRREAYLQ